MKNCHNCGAPRDIYRDSCEYCDTFHNDRQTQTYQYTKSQTPTYMSGIPFNMVPTQGYACSGTFVNFSKDYE